MEKNLLMGFVVALLSVQGCATKTYGRLEPVEMSQQSTHDCREIDEQIVKAQAFINDVNRKSEFSGADVLAILIDFGIGNAIEKNAAIKSADDRIARLKDLRKSEGCPEAVKSVQREE
ncbi:MAG TPA: hypothetical protein VLN59_09910 [Burkholderiales bacterium]|nr:hypothetical protein [Burkholderiales bacterium]